MPDATSPQDDPRSVDDLFNDALSTPDEEVYWSAVMALHWRSTAEVLGRAAALARSQCSLQRGLAADVLGQLSVERELFVSERTTTLLEMAAVESDGDVWRTILVAFSHLRVAAGIGVATTQLEHPDANVRHAVSLALAGHDDPRAIEGLIRLSRDESPIVRNWATFGLGTQSELDSAEIREALAARLDDSDLDTRREAMMGLAQRGDERAIPAIMRELSDRGAEGVGSLVIEAGEVLADREKTPDRWNRLEPWRE